MSTAHDLIKVAVLFGGPSTEHEVSIITGLEVVGALDTRRFEAIPVYVARDGAWYTGAALTDADFYRRLPGSLAEATRITLLPDGRARGLRVLDNRRSLWNRMAGSQELETLPVDVFFPAFHGSVGEDGCMQGLLETAGLAYVGSGVAASAIGMNKALCKSLMHAAGIPVLPWAQVTREDWRADPLAARDAVLATPGLERFPLFAKPCNLGSSVGISPAGNAEELDTALSRIFRLDSAAIVEPQVTQLTEINVSVMQGRERRTSVVERPISKTGVLTYEDKYGAGGKGKKAIGPRIGSIADAERRIDPQDLPAKTKTLARALAERAFRTLDCAGVVRVDFILDGRDGRLYFNEINTLPGSMAYYLWEHSSPALSYTALLTELVEHALEARTIKAGLARDANLKTLF